MITSYLMNLILFYFITVPLYIYLAAYSFEYKGAKLHPSENALNSFVSHLHVPMSWLFRGDPSLMTRILLRKSKEANFMSHFQVTTTNDVRVKYIISSTLIFIVNLPNMLGLLLGVFILSKGGSITNGASVLDYSLYFLVVIVTYIATANFGKRLIYLQ
jgi:hypothetical protein